MGTELERPGGVQKASTGRLDTVVAPTSCWQLCSAESRAFQHGLGWILSGGALCHVEAVSESVFTRRRGLCSLVSALW